MYYLNLEYYQNHKVVVISKKSLTYYFHGLFTQETKAP